MSRNGGIASPPLPSRSWPFESPARLVDISPSVASREVTSLTTSNLQSSAILWSLLFEKFIPSSSTPKRETRGNPRRDSSSLRFPPMSFRRSGHWRSMAGGAKIGAHAHPPSPPNEISSRFPRRAPFLLFSLSSGSGSGSGSMVIRAAHASLQPPSTTLQCAQMMTPKMTGLPDQLDSFPFFLLEASVSSRQAARPAR